MGVIGSKVAGANSSAEKRRHHYSSTYIKRIKWNVTNIKSIDSTSWMKMEILHERYKIQSSVKEN